MVRLSEPAGRWVLLTTILGSAMATLDSTVVNVALPALGADLHAGISGMQWVVNAYMLTLAAFLLVGGSLGDRFGRRRVFVIGVLWFAAASILCGVATTTPVLVASRALQGVGGALLTPGSLALIQATFHRDDRARAVGLWSGFSGVAAAVGPFVGGWLVDAASWRWVFFLNAPLTVLVLVAARHVPESHQSTSPGRFDLAGTLACVVGLGGITYAFIEADAHGLRAPAVLIAACVGVLACVAFVAIERRTSNPMMPLALFRSRDFSAANLVTLCAYAALSGTIFFLVLYLQVVAKYPATRAGLALLPMTAVMLLLSSWIGGFAGRVGPRRPMAVGGLLAAGGLLWLSRLGESAPYVRGVLPAALLFGLGMAGIAVPVTITVLASADPSRSGIASGINNAVARAAGLLAVAALPFVTGLSGQDYASALAGSFQRAMIACALLFVAAAALAWFLVRDATVTAAPSHPPARASCPIGAPPPAGG